MLDVIRSIRDPEKPNTLEELDVVTEKCVEVQELGEDEYLIIIKFSPTVPHCSLATLIGESLLIMQQTITVAITARARLRRTETLGSRRSNSEAPQPSDVSTDAEPLLFLTL